MGWTGCETALRRAASGGVGRPKWSAVAVKSCERAVKNAKAILLSFVDGAHARTSFGLLREEGWLPCPASTWPLCGRPQYSSSSQLVRAVLVQRPLGRCGIDASRRHLGTTELPSRSGSCCTKRHLAQTLCATESPQR
eukprot:scaffold123105_cov30-Tisochrysis_lutea.AAC.2